MYSHDRSKRILALPASSPASYRFPAALHAFFSPELLANRRSLASSLDRLCQMDIETSGAHSLRINGFSTDWKALIMKETIDNREEVPSDGSTLIERIRWKRLEKSAGRSEKISDPSSAIQIAPAVQTIHIPHIGKCSRCLTLTIKASRSTW